MLEPHSDEQFERVCPDGTVYNLEVEEWHTYTANGIVVHNCHHAPAPSYRQILDYLQPELLLGITATPFRTDLTSLQTVFDRIVYAYGIRDAIQDRWLVDIQAVRVTGTANLDTVATRGGDFVEGQLQQALNTSARNAIVVEAYLTHAPGSKALVFASGVDHAYALAECFREQGITAEALDGSIPGDVRRSTLQRFREGTISVLVNAMLFTEGFDDPSIDTVILARPTKSLALFTQMVGRGTRLAPGKDHMILIDIVDATRRHKIVSLKHLLGLRRDLATGTRVSQAMAREARVTAQAETWLTRVAPHRIESQDVVDLFADLVEDTTPTVDWRDVADGLADVMEDLPLKTDILHECVTRFGMVRPEDPSTPTQRQRLQDFGWPSDEADKLAKWAASWALDRHREALATWTQNRATQWANLFGTSPDEVSTAVRDALWKLTPASAKQKAWLRRLGTPEELVEGLTKGEASWLIDHTPRRASRASWEEVLFHGD
nr:helicase-related protein [Sulfobacillus thermosulfidooxidans]